MMNTTITMITIMRMTRLAIDVIITDVCLMMTFNGLEPRNAC